MVFQLSFQKNEETEIDMYRLELSSIGNIVYGVP